MKEIKEVIKINGHNFKFYARINSGRFSAEKYAQHLRNTGNLVRILSLGDRGYAIYVRRK
jgi:hypothetical protein